MKETTFLTCIDLIDDITSKNPTAIAVSNKDTQLTYAQVKKASVNIAYYLQEQGIKTGDVVGLLSSNNYHFILLLLGIMRVGAVVLPLDATLPQARINTMLSSSQAKFIICKDIELLNDIEVTKSSLIQTINLEVNSFLTAENNNFDADTSKKLNTLYKIKGDDIACIFYTSGSSGQPKGVIFPHRSILHFIQWQKNQFYINHTDKCLQLTRLSFDVILRATLTGLISGANIFFPPEDIELTNEEMLEIIENESITYFHVVPSLMKIWLLQTEKKYSFSKLRLIFFAGEKLEKNVINDFLSINIGNKTDYINLYGPTETVMAKCFYKIDKNNLTEKLIFPVGKPIPNTRIYLYKDGEIISDNNIEGEIIIDSDYKSLGYQHNQTTFIQLSNLENSVYRTGDIGYFDNNKDLHILGRIDEQIKINGVRIELTEIDTILGDFEYITQAATFFDLKDNKLKAYLVTNNDFCLKELITFLRARLLSEMVPQQYFKVKKLLFSNNGKLDRRATSLQTNTPIKIKHNENRIEELNSIEKTLIEIFSTVFNIEVNIDDDFFYLGGNSLIATFITHRIKKIFNKNIRISDIYKYHKISELAQYIKTLKENILTAKRVNVNITCENKLIPEQAIFATYQKLHKDSPAYNIGYCFKITNLDEEKLICSIKKVLKKYEILSSIVLEQNNDFIYIQNEDISDIIHTVKLSPENNPLEYIQTIYKKPFDLQKNLIKIRLIYSKQETYLVIFFHHIISDGLSSRIFLEEIKKFYEYKNNDQYYKALTGVQSDNFEIDKKFWKDYLLNYPKDKFVVSKNKSSIDKKGNYVIYLIDSEHVTFVDQLSKEHQITNFSVFLSIFVIVLYQISNNKSCVIGTPFSNRDYYHSYDNMGCFVKTLPFISNIDLDESLLTFITRTFVQISAIIDNFQKIDLSQFIQENNLIDYIDPFNLFEIFFSYNYDYLDHIQMGEMNLQRIDIHNNSCKFPLSFMLNRTVNDTIKLEIEYDNDLFSSELINLLVSQYKNILTNLLTDKNEKLSKITATNLLILQNNTVKSSENDVNIVKHIYENVLIKPDFIAIHDTNVSITYKQLWHRVTAFYDVLSQYDMEKQSVIAVLLPSSIDLIAVMLATWSQEYVYLPIDSELPSERINYILSNSSASLIFTNTTLLQKFDLSKYEIVDCNEVLSSDNLIEPVKNYPLTTPAYILYTSGSTGQPKGVLQVHNTIINLLEHQMQEFSDLGNHIVAQCASPFFDVSIQEISYVLATGCQLVIIPPCVKINPLKFWDYIISFNITMLFIPPAILQILAEFKPNFEYIKLKYIIVAGEALKITDHIRTLFSNINTKLINHYGPTETHVVSSYQLEQAPATWETFPSIGLSINNCELFVLNEKFELVSEGEIGELYITGKNLALGYYKNNLLTDDRFIFIMINNKKYRCYKTGDLVKVKDKYLYFIDRIDQQINLNGYRIEPKEIESILLSSKKIKQVYVCAKNINDNIHLIAYYTAMDKLPLDNKFLNELITRYLPRYMHPAHYIFLEKFPLTVNGKIDNSILPIPSLNITELAEMQEYSVIQAKLVSILSKIIGKHSTISKTENFFQLGLNSLAMAKLLVNITREFNVDINFNDIYNNNTLIKLETYITEHAHIYSAVSNKVFTNQKYYLPSPQQTRILNDISRGQNPLANNLTFSFILKGDIDLIKLNFAIQETLIAHDIFSTIYNQETNQFIIQQSIVPAEIELFNAQSDVEIKNLIESFVHTNLYPFDRGFYRIALLKISDRSCMLLFNIHHLMFDGTSWQLFVKELSNRYNNVDLVNEKASYQKYALFLSNNPHYYQSNLAYLNQIINKFPLLLPKLKPQASLSLYENYKNSFNIEINNKLTYNLHQIAEKYSVTIFVLLLYSYGLTIKNFICNDVPVIGLTVNGRNHIEFEKTLGLFIQRSVVDISCINSSVDINDIFNLQASIYECLSNSLLSIYAVQNFEELGNLKALPYPNFNFVFQNYEKSQIEFNDLSYKPTIIKNSYSSFNIEDIAFIVDASIDTMMIEIVYNKNANSQDFIENFGQNYLNVLKEVIEKLKKC